MNDFRFWLRLIEATLDPDERLNRAKKIGFDTSRVWYHGSTGRDIEAFDPALLGRNTGAKSATKGFFFTSDPKVAVSYGKSERFMPDSAKLYCQRPRPEGRGLKGKILTISDQQEAKPLTSRICKDTLHDKLNWLPMVGQNT